MLANKTLTELLDAFSSPDPTPGGGSAAALAGALGASLLAMVAGLKKTRTGAPEERTALDAARAELLTLRDTLVELVDRDAAAYDAVVAAYRKPKGTDEERVARKAAMQEAMRVAAEAPLATMKACARGMDLAAIVAEHGSPSAMSDVGVGLHSLVTAFQGGWLNVEVNLEAISDSAMVDSIVNEMKPMMASTANLHAAFSQAGLGELMSRGATRLNLAHGRSPSES